MDDYRINKRIEELHSIPGNWSQVQKDSFLGEGFLPMAGKNPLGKYQTKKITLSELNRNLSGMLSVLTAESSNISQNGQISVSSVRSAGTNISVKSSQVSIQPGWYQYSAQLSIAYTGNPLNRQEPISLSSNWYNQSKTCVFDFSYEHTEIIELSCLINNTSSGEQNITLTLGGLPSPALTGLTCKLNSLSVIAVRVND